MAAQDYLAGNLGFVDALMHAANLRQRNYIGNRWIELARLEHGKKRRNVLLKFSRQLFSATVNIVEGAGPPIGNKLPTCQ